MTYRHAASKEVMRGKRQRRVNAFVPALTASCCPIIFPHFRIFHKSLGERSQDHLGTSGSHPAQNPAQSRVNYKATSVSLGHYLGPQNLQGWRLHNLSRQPVPMDECPHSTDIRCLAIFWSAKLPCTRKTQTCSDQGVFGIGVEVLGFQVAWLQRFLMP